MVTPFHSNLTQNIRREYKAGFNNPTYHNKN